MFFKTLLCSIVVLALTANAYEDYKKIVEEVISTTCVGHAPKITKRYKPICDVKADWVGAVSLCSKLGMRLATVENKAQEAALVRRILTSVCGRKGMWIGGMNQQDAEEWVWEGTGKDVSYTCGWADGKVPKFNKDAHCMEMMPRMRGFRSKRCTNRLHFVCESVPADIVPAKTVC